eukprot:GCRY01001909.1.p1 GENE.GCRY01001909.1~~GCRY01001909.1.p1  ORF type:complete len:518 (+),score=65.00 GCRY01001909.1:241-1794(+)
MMLKLSRVYFQLIFTLSVSLKLLLWFFAFEELTFRGEITSFHLQFNEVQECLFRLDLKDSDFTLSNCHISPLLLLPLRLLSIFFSIHTCMFLGNICIDVLTCIFVLKIVNLWWKSKSSSEDSLQKIGTAFFFNEMRKEIANGAFEIDSTFQQFRTLVLQSENKSNTFTHKQGQRLSHLSRVLDQKCSDCEHIPQHEDKNTWIFYSNVVLACLILNPFSLLSGGGFGLQSSTHLALVLFVYFSLKGNVFKSYFSLALTVHHLPQCLLLFPFSLLCLRVFHERKCAHCVQNFALQFAKHCLFFFGVVVFVLLSSIALLSVSLTHTSILNPFHLCSLFQCNIITFFSGFSSYFYDVSLLTPNLGLWWYMLQEVFPQYRAVFVFTFHWLLLMFAPSLTLHYRNQPFMFLFVMYFLIVIFQPFSTLTDLAVALSFLSFSPQLIPHLRYLFLNAQVFFYVVLAAPVMWHQWLYTGTGNANFYYACSLVLGVLEGWFLLDTMHANSRLVLAKQSQLLPEEGKEK